jgi:hypothetical protein
MANRISGASAPQSLPKLHSSIFGAHAIKASVRIKLQGEDGVYAVLIPGCPENATLPALAEHTYDRECKVATDGMVGDNVLKHRRSWTVPGSEIAPAIAHLPKPAAHANGQPVSAQ